MHEDLHLGTIGRTRVGLSWSVIVIVGIIAFNLATSEFRIMAPGFNAGIYWTMALVTAVVFLASLLGHELAHAVVARRRGVVVDGIVLWALGGVAKLNGDAPDARSELRIAIAGLGASVACALVFGLSALGLSALGASALVVTALWWLAEINAVLALFNLVPAYPLDGGRVLRAGLWRHWDDRLRATDAAAGVGGFVGSALIGLGLFAWLFVPMLAFNGVWLALVGWFVLGASRQERRAVRLTSALDGLCVGDVMRPVTRVAPAYATLEDIVEQYLRPEHLDRCPLVDFNGAVAGLVTLEQVDHVPAEHWRSMRASEVAWPIASLAQLAPGAALASFVGQLSSVPSHSALVLEDSRLVGTVTPRDVEMVMRSPEVFRGRPTRPFATASGG
ncbi:MAG TPA: site-2 protease family protein [Acidimicrobiales bacterium]